MKTSDCLASLLRAASADGAHRDPPSQAGGAGTLRPAAQGGGAGQNQPDWHCSADSDAGPTPVRARASPFHDAL